MQMYCLDLGLFQCVLSDLRRSGIMRNYRDANQVCWMMDDDAHCAAEQDLSREFLS